MKPEPITLTFAGTDGEPGAGITAYGLLLWPPGASLATPEPEPVKIADGMSEANAAEVVRRWNAYPELLAAISEAVEDSRAPHHRECGMYRYVPVAGRPGIVGQGPCDCWVGRARAALKLHATPPDPECDREPIAEGDYHYYAKPPEG